MSEDPTQITLRTVLEAINGIGVELHQFREEVRGLQTGVERRLDRLETGQLSLHEEMQDRLRSLESSINVLSGDVTRLRGREESRQLVKEIKGEGLGPRRTIDPNPNPEGKDKRT